MPERDLSVDFYRVSAIGLVVVGHWLVASATYSDGEFGLQNPLEEMPWTQWLTLVFQVIPAFFLMAGYASAASWTRRAEPAQGWLRYRLARTLGPTGAYAAIVLAVVLVLLWTGVDGTKLAFGGWAVAYHLWFLVTFVLVVVATPVAVAADERWGLAVPAALAIAVGVIDVAYLGADVPYVGYLNYVLAWGAVYQLGIAWRSGRLTGYRPVVLALVAAAVLAALLIWGPYPISMIGVPGDEIQNTGPPSLALVAFAAAQAGLLIAAAPAVDRALKAARVQRSLAVANGAVMGLYLWHMVPVVIVALIGYPTGLLPQPPMGSGEWWLVRLPWIAAIFVVAAVLLAFLRWQRRWLAAPLPSLRVPLPGAWGLATLLTGALVAAAAILGFTIGGFAPDGHFPLQATLLFAAGAILVALTPRASGADSGRR
ncbi:acyltransferase family protein [Mycolicibacterium sp. HK-90]|uniref:acyltransferase family protein n=1 Tax=Mycolicibacterium sp. HK-90 TaxID=3056937 RepID=UPI00265A0804|nr:acyltransferase family protein [Mycolicibacterium sp. HK-90]WKG04592.1 acyltransferase family protein [Mycolicibacterium sp. HK-90]